MILARLFAYDMHNCDTVRASNIFVILNEVVFHGRVDDRSAIAARFMNMYGCCKNLEVSQIFWRSPLVDNSWFWFCDARL